MKRLSGFLSLLGLTILITCKSKPSLQTAATRNSLLWEVSGNGLSKPSYFLGTMHLMCAEDASLSEATLSIIKKVKSIYLEVDLDNAGELLSGILEMANQEKETLQSVLTASEYERVRAFFELHQPRVPFYLLEKQHPLMIASSLYEMFLTCENKNGIELLIVKEAYDRKKEVKGLETLAFQASIFSDIPYADQAKELLKTIDSLPKHKALLDDMITIYKQQNIEKLYELTTQEEAGTAGHLDILIDKRNKNWVMQFDTLATKQSTLFAVGAGHLGGTNGVINLLERKGYKLRPLRNDAVVPVSPKVNR